MRNPLPPRHPIAIPPYGSLEAGGIAPMMPAAARIYG